jgi:hypothetical protein
MQCFVSGERPDTLRYTAPRVLGYKAAISTAESTHEYRTVPGILSLRDCEI